MWYKEIEEIIKLEEKIKKILRDYHECRYDLCKKCRSQGFFDSNWCKECRWNGEDD